MDSRKLYIFFAFLVILCFGSSLKSSFVFDDRLAIVENEDVRNIQDSLVHPSLFQHDFWGNEMSDDGSHKSYRPLTIIVYRIIFCLNWLFKEPTQLNPVYFHLTNLLSYYVLVCLLHRTLLDFLSCSMLNLSRKTSEQMSLFVTTIFTVHPIHCEPVS